MSSHHRPASLGGRADVRPNPFPIYGRVTGTNGSIGAFHFVSGNQQALTGDKGVIRNTCYHTKIYSIDKPITLTLGTGLQDGQLKRITCVHKGTAEANITVTCPTLLGDYTQIVFSKAGDQIDLLWNGSSWSVLYSINFMEPLSNTPVVS